MSAMVARTIPKLGAFTLRARGMRVTHTLLFSAVLTVSPGVCGACATGCPARGTTATGRPGTGVAFAVAATHGCGSCCDTIPDGPPAGSDSPGASPAAVADAADGISLPCCRGAMGCECLLEPRSAEAAVPPATSPLEPGEPMPAAVAVLPPTGGSHAAIRPASARARPPERPVRVLYGVWRN